MATMNNIDYHNAIYKEVRSYLIGLFSCEVIKGYQNDSPLPQNGVVMTIISERDTDQAASYYQEEEGTAYVQNSVEVMLQLDFYGDWAASRARQIANFWRSEYTTSALNTCQPLYSKQPVRLPFVNEQNQNEQRWLLEVYLQYNPEFKQDQAFLDLPIISTERA
ncbi:phage neck terminator protein [Acinetobacter larvae]|uniref:Phage neck terminator protein gp12-like domain-containing protein n=1 Tax=Acinetobacter larvae TaxID=1789224 RepID=A0A1B2M3Z1_9GAMM|nr:hypothetical protein [Acinetobacter larvae]AOA59926.1 hypothetical protein BFG52_08140 [Acinetobacter larvae]